MTFRCYKGLSNSERTKLKCEAKKSGKKVRPLGIETIYDDRTGKIIEQGVFQVEALKGPIWVASNPEVLEPFKNILKYKFGPRPEFDNIAYIEQRLYGDSSSH